MAASVFCKDFVDISYENSHTHTRRFFVAAAYLFLKCRVQISGSRITVHFKIFVDQFCLFFIKFAVQNTSVVQIRDQSFLKNILCNTEIKKNPMKILSLQPTQSNIYFVCRKHYTLDNNKMATIWCGSVQCYSDVE